MKYTRAILFSILITLLFSCSSDDGDSNPTGNNNEPSTYSISGTVTNQDEEVVSGYTVTISGGKSATTTTNSSGEYSFVDLEADLAYSVTVDSVSFSVESLNSDETFHFGVIVAKAIQISGTITDLQDNPVEGVPLTFNPDEFTPGNEISTTSDASGYYEFEGELVPGKIWIVRTESPDHRYGAYSDDPNVAGIDGRGEDKAGGSYITNDVVVDFKQIDDFVASWRADETGISTAVSNDGYISSVLSVHDETTYNWFWEDGSGNAVPVALNSPYTLTGSSSGNIHSVVLESGSNSYEGIYEITKSDGTWTLTLEVVNTNDEHTPPTVSGGFGSSNGGADGQDNVWTFKFNR